jgi:hypothetical protein
VPKLLEEEEEEEEHEDELEESTSRTSCRAEWNGIHR